LVLQKQNDDNSSTSEPFPFFLLLVDCGESTENLPVSLSRNNPSCQGYYECLIRGKSQRGVLVRLLAIFESRGIQVLSCSYETNDEQPTFGAILVLELKKNSDSETMTLVEKLMDTRVVSSIEFSSLEGRSFTNFRFPIAILPGERGVIIQPEYLVDYLQFTFQGKGIPILDCGRNYGRLLADNLRKKKISDSGSDLVVQMIKATGWGIGKYEENEKGQIIFILKDPAFGIDSESKYRIDFLAGMIQGMIEGILNCSMCLLGSRFDGKTNALVVKLSRSLSSI